MDTEDTGEDVILSIPVYVENDLEIDQDGNFNVQTFIFSEEREDEDPKEIKTKFSTLIKNVIDHFQEDATVDGTNTLYCIAHELSRQAEVLRSKGDYMDRGVYADDLFKEDPIEEDVIKKSNN